MPRKAHVADVRPVLRDVTLTELELAMGAAVRRRYGRAAELAREAAEHLERLEAEQKRAGCAR